MLIFVFSLCYLQPKYIQRLKAIRATLLRSDFFQTHEVIGSSLLFVHDRTQASIWLIDFAKTVSLPGGANITHMNEWIVGNHEDGYLIGINNLIRIFEEILAGDDDEPQSNEQSNEEANICEFNENDDATSNPAVCTCEHKQESAEVQMETNMNLPQEIDAMKIDQTMQQSNRERADDAK